MRFGRVGTVAVGCAVVACTSAGSMSTSVPSMAFDTLFVYSSVVGDTSLLQPDWLVASQGGVLVGDVTNARLTFISRTGEVEWIYAARGQGPLELLMPFDAVVTDSEIWVLDLSLRKILRLTHGGEPIGSVSVPDLRGGIPAQIDLLENGYVLITTQRLELARIATDSWRLESLQPITWAEPPPDDWASTATVTAGHGQVVVGMRFGPEIMVMREGEATRYTSLPGDVPYRLRARRRVVDGMSFPDEASETVYGAVSIAMSDDQIYVLHGGRLGEVSHPNNTLIELSLDGAYRQTIVVPLDAIAMDAVKDTFYFIVNGEPTVVALRGRADDPG